jgi:hypothetical protein
MFHAYRQTEVHIGIIGALHVNEQPIIFTRNKVDIFYSAAIVSPASEKWATIMGYRKQLKRLISKGVSLQRESKNGL